MKETKVKKINLCPACGTCPEVVLMKDKILIGEKSNIVKLKKEDWNYLVRKIRAGELGEVA